MKVFIARQYDQESSRIMGIYQHFEDAKQLVDKLQIQIDKEWEEDFGENSDHPCKAFIESGPCDKVRVIEYEVQEWFDVERDIA